MYTSYFTEIRFGFTPIVTRNLQLHAVLEQLDLKMILAETDSPYFMPAEVSFPIVLIESIGNVRSYDSRCRLVFVVHIQ
jgi:Tat protein secretion system quality control protein TatD with DNase activity